VLLAALAGVLIVAFVATTALLVRNLRASPSAGTTKTSAQVAGTATHTSILPTPYPSDPRSNGWTPVGGGNFADVQFSAGGGQRGYLCGMSTGTGKRLVGVTTDGGDTWQIGTSPAGYDGCSLQVSATNPLDAVLLSNVGACAGGCLGFDAHYSIDGGKTWSAAPFPANASPDAGAVWAGSYLYVWSDSTPEAPQQAFLKVSANGGAFSAIDLNALVPGASGVFIQQMVAGGAGVYVTVAYNGCSAAQGCTAVVASADGGKTWARISNIFNLHVVWAVGTTLYGEVFGSGQPQVQTSTDNGTSWQPLALPLLPDGTTVAAEDQLLPAADGTVFALDPRSGTITYLRSGSWQVIPFSSLGVDGPLGTLTIGPDGHPQRVWVFSPSPTSNTTPPMLTLYWHAV
jgi:hypothetical protein